MIDWARLVERVQAGDEAATLELYGIFNRGIRYHLALSFGVGDLQDRIHDAFIVVFQAIRRGQIRQPECLGGFIRTVADRHTIARIKQSIEDRRKGMPSDLDPAPDPEHGAIAGEEYSLVAAILDMLPAKDSEVLKRFYLEEQPKEQISAEMHLTETQFRLLKSRAKARFAERGRKVLAKPIRRAA